MLDILINECEQIQIPNFTFVIAKFTDNISGA